MKIEELEVGKEYWVINGHWSFKVLKKEKTGVNIKMSNGVKTLLPFTETSLEIKVYE